MTNSVRRDRFRSSCLAFAVVALALALVGCGGGSDDRSSSDEPRPGDPRFGAAGNVLMRDPVREADGSFDELWIGFNDGAEWQALVELADRLGQERAPYISGRLVVDSAEPLGFYFDPSTTDSAEVVAELRQTSIHAIKSNPTEFAANEPGGHWAVGGMIERLVPSR
jgi:hypothetical protein